MTRSLASGCLVLTLSTFGCPPATRTAPARPDAGVIAVGPARPQPANRFSWVASSRNGKASVSQQPTTGGRCNVQTIGAAENWIGSECIADAADEVFLSDDGLEVLVLITEPKWQQTWQVVPLVRLYDRGVLRAQATAGALFRSSSSFSRAGDRFGWALGTAGLEGDKPKLATDRHIELHTTASTTLRFGFDGSGFPDEPPPVEPATDGKPQVFKWTDGHGEEHYTDDPESIPAKFRAKAKPVTVVK